ncbi:MAG: hypothetical protein HYZ75_17005 [Elusimicrobia bacterium]|nr:hypothetical protein [Elusimicrobiota bacterium]
MSPFLILALCAFLAPAARAADSPLSPTQFQGLLQRFVDKAYLKAFRHLGDERDFDHGHLLFDAGSKRPRAILYHTQEMAKGEPAQSDFAYIDAQSRNWLQWIDEDKIEKADGFQRKEFPQSAYWSWFVERKLPTFKEYHTIIDKMLDPALVGADTEKSEQWEFTRVDCGAKPPARQPIDILLPGGEKVCLALSAA